MNPFAQFQRSTGPFHLVNASAQVARALAGDTNLSVHCRALSAKLFSPEAMVKQITAALAHRVDATLDRHGLRPGDNETISAINSVASCAGTTRGALKSKCNTTVVYWMVFAESSSLASQAL